MQNKTDFKVSFFKNVFNQNPLEISIFQFLHEIKKCKYKKQIEQIRNETDKQNRNKLKQYLPTISTSGTFNLKRKPENLIKHSSLIQIDIDNVSNIFDYLVLFELDKFIFSSFMSPSGTGIKAIVKIENDVLKHKTSFLALEEYFKSIYKIQIDKSCKDITRLMYISADHLINIKPNSTTFNELNASQYFKHASHPTEANSSYKLNFEPPFNATQRNVETAICIIEKDHIDIFSDYSNHITIAYSLISEYGTAAYSYFVRLKRISSNFNEHKTKTFFNKLLPYPTRITIAKFFSICKQHNVYFKT